MGEKIRVSAKTVADAVTEASIQLGTTSDNIEYVVVEHETKGFLGIGAKRAVIEARIKVTDEEFISGLFSGKKGTSGAKKAKASRPAGSKEEGAAAKKQAPVPKEKKDAMPEEKAPAAAEGKERSAQKEQGGQKQNKAQNQNRSDKPAKKKQEAPAEGEAAPAAQAKPAQRQPKANRVPADPAVAQERAKTFLEQTFGAMGLNVEIKTSFEDDVLSVEMIGDDMGMLIGKRGQTLDALQYLVSLVVNKGKASYVRVKLDTEDYRNRRKATLENLAKNIAFKVKKTHKPVYLEPMNPYERRIIHSALQNDPFVTTHSEGEEPNRKVVVTMKKRERTERSDRIEQEEKAITDELV